MLNIEDTVCNAPWDSPQQSMPVVKHIYIYVYTYIYIYKSLQNCIYFLFYCLTCITEAANHMQGPP